MKQIKNLLSETMNYICKQFFLMRRELVITKDGSHTIFVPELNEHYHSINGAIEESLHVFIHSGLDYLINQNKDINILEIGFGTGLNAILTEKYSHDHRKNIYYTGIEAFPLQPDIIQQLNYNSNNTIDAMLFQKMHQLPWDKSFQELCAGFWLQKVSMCLENYSPEKEAFDLIYFDAFSPEIQPVLWEKPVFEKLYDSLKNNGILTTYSAKGDVRRCLQAVGFTIERLPGALGKREMLRAKKEFIQ